MSILFTRPSWGYLLRLPRLTSDELETLMWETGKTVNGAKEIIFETRVNGKAVLGNGHALIRTSAGKAKL
jgi:hypothetical protein